MQINDNESLPFEFLCVLNTHMGNIAVSVGGKNDVVICQKRIASISLLHVSFYLTPGAECESGCLHGDDIKERVSDKYTSL